ncbi:MAK11 [Candida oxycetoniae]|uniref:MAK11 n=1 Tax=Candida oxycetoniae TaxID=497107 RepID=A0AAI9T0M4_9ASCO|nr:MAK11 [Candida oxycetoniae]KAI3406618.2 MAK11 [Candida oxycetoniae]
MSESIEANASKDESKSVAFDKVNIKSSLKGGNGTSSISVTLAKDCPVTLSIQFRIFVGSYEHNLLCLSVMLDPKNVKEPVFQPIFHFQAHSLSIKSIDVAKRYLVTGSNDEHIRIYDLQKRKELGTLLSHQGTITALRFSKEGNHNSASGGDAAAPAAAAVAAATTAGKWLLSGSEDGKIIIWRTKDWEIFATLKGHTDKINDLSIHPSGRVAISVSQDKTIRLWNLMTAKKAAVLKIKGKDHLGQSGQFVKWNSTGHLFIVGLSNTVFVYKTSTAKIVKKLKFKSTLMCMDIVMIDSKEWLIIGFGDGSIGVFDFEKVSKSISDSNEETKKEKEEEKGEKGEEDEEEEKGEEKQIEPVYSLRGHTNRIKDFQIFQNEDTQDIPFLISVSSDGKIVVWNLSIRDQVAVYDTGERLNCIACAPEYIEKVDTMKKRYIEEEEKEKDLSESEFETDSEEIMTIMNGQKKKNKKGGKLKKSKKRKVQVTLE